jgi:hypothetical protein
MFAKQGTLIMAAERCFRLALNFAMTNKELLDLGV